MDQILLAQNAHEVAGGLLPQLKVCGRWACSSVLRDGVARRVWCEEEASSMVLAPEIFSELQHAAEDTGMCAPGWLTGCGGKSEKNEGGAVLCEHGYGSIVVRSSLHCVVSDVVHLGADVCVCCVWISGGGNG